ncbi:hypothetical protein N9A45_00575 [bacterium]|nr:hypothetical protein [bacterium]
MFYFILGFVCGVVVGQELGLPKFKPHIMATYTKLFPKGTTVTPSPESKKD